MTHLLIWFGCGKDSADLMRTWIGFFFKYAAAVRMWMEFCGCGADMDFILQKSADAVRTWIDLCGRGAVVVKIFVSAL